MPYTGVDKGIILAYYFLYLQHQQLFRNLIPTEYFGELLAIRIEA